MGPGRFKPNRMGSKPRFHKSAPAQSPNSDTETQDDRDYQGYDGYFGA